MHSLESQLGYTPLSGLYEASRMLINTILSLDIMYIPYSGYFSGRGGGKIVVAFMVQCQTTEYLPANDNSDSVPYPPATNHAH